MKRNRKQQKWKVKIINYKKKEIVSSLFDLITRVNIRN